MEISKLHNKISFIEKEYKDKIKPVLVNLSKECRQFQDLDVIIPCGCYKGRVGKITHVSCSDGEVRGIIQPYKKTTRGELTKELLWDRVDARTYWKLSEIKEK